MDGWMDLVTLKLLQLLIAAKNVLTNYFPHFKCVLDINKKAQIIRIRHTKFRGDFGKSPKVDPFYF